MVLKERKEVEEREWIRRWKIDYTIGVFTQVFRLVSPYQENK